MALDANTTSKDNLAFQKRLKALGFNVPTNGQLDAKTMAAAQQIATHIGYNRSLGGIDAAFLKALDAFEKRKFHKVIIERKTFIVDEHDYQKLVKALGPKAAAAMRPWVSMADYAYGLWQSDSKNKADNWFIGSVIELRAGVKLPDAQVMSKAVASAATLQKKAGALTLSEAEFQQHVRTIKTAMEAISSYRDGLFGGGDKLVRELELVRDGSLVTLQVLGAVVTGGTSTVGAQVAMQAGLSAYGQVLGEIDKASKTSDYSLGGGAARVTLAAGGGALVGWAVKGASGKQLEEAVLKLALKESSPLLRQYVVKAMTAGGIKLIEDGLAALPGLADPTKKWTLESVAKEAVQSFLSGIGAQALGTAAEKWSKSASKYVSVKKIEALAGRLKLDKVGLEAAKKAADAASARAVQEVLAGWKPGTDPKKFDQEVEARLLQSREVQAAVKKHAKP